MSDISVISRSQRIVVNPFSSSVSVINIGPIGPAGPAGGVTTGYVDAQLALKASLSGATFTGNLAISGANPAADFYASSAPLNEKRWRLIADQNGYFRFSAVNDANAASIPLFEVNRDGITSASITIADPVDLIVPTPTANNHAATKAYVDSAVAGGGGGGLTSLIGDTSPQLGGDLDTNTYRIIFNPVAGDKIVLYSNGAGNEYKMGIGTALMFADVATGAKFEFRANSIPIGQVNASGFSHPQAPSSASHLTRKDYVDTGLASKVTAVSTVTKLYGPITQAQYDALSPAASDTLYIIVN